MLPLHRTFKSFAFVISSSFFISCSNHSKQDAEIIKALSETIVNSSQIMDASSKDIMFAFEEKLRDPGSSERAKVWYPRIKQVQQLSLSALNYIDNFKNNLSSKSDFSSGLFEKLTNYKGDILTIDPKINLQFQKSLRVFTSAVDSAKENQKIIFQNYFKNASESSTIAMLNKFQNNIKIIENKVAMFCYENVGATDGDGFCTFFSAISILNSSVVQPGGNLEVISGIGEFNTHNYPQIFIYKKPVPIDETGVAIYKLKAPSKPGKYYIPVKISYTDQNGTQQTVNKEIEYTVANIQKQ